MTENLNTTGFTQRRKKKLSLENVDFNNTKEKINR